MRGSVLRASDNSAREAAEPAPDADAGAEDQLDAGPVCLGLACGNSSPAKRLCLQRGERAASLADEPFRVAALIAFLNRRPPST
jgi:hypothetical protein